MDPRTPVLVGAGQVNHTDGDAPSPVSVLADAVRRAVADTAGANVLRAVDSVRVVQSLSLRHGDPARAVARELGIDPGTTVLTTAGGNMPQALVAHTAGEILAGRVDLAVCGGVECWRTLNRHRKRDERPRWADGDDTGSPSEVFGPELKMGNDHEAAIGLRMPVNIYPLFETALRGRLGSTPDEHLRRVAELWARFSAVAATNPYAAIPRAWTADEIASAGTSNRFISYPYRKVMNSNNDVDQAAAVVLCSAERATALGIPRDRWVFLHGAARAHETPYVSNRFDLSRCPPIAAAGEAALKRAGVGVDDIAHVDLYSCFPSAVQIAAEELGFTLDRQLTVTGGLTFAGGPWNDYVTHSLATMIDVLRGDPDAYGLVSANGGILTKHDIGVYSCRPAEGPRAVDAQRDFPTRDDDPSYTGPATVESYTVAHDRDDRPSYAFLTALTPAGTRVVTRTDDPRLAADLEASDPLGQPITLPL